MVVAGTVIDEVDELLEKDEFEWGIGRPDYNWDRHLKMKST